MRMRLNKLELTCKKAVVTVPFTDFSYFYGEIGAMANRPSLDSLITASAATSK